MTNFQEMHAALSQADTALREFLILWTEQLSEDRQAQLHDWMDKGVRCGVHYIVGGNAPLLEITAVDSAGNHNVLERIDFQKARA